ncbi:MAG: hypothetical protein CVU84_13515 [Firmicutes bacterium HGW-Firmicutes-1]|jgi:archaellum component FlaF (FlaF/FlaG flagellin family)|nr:MAG: hypothetical protein CVU84_13515 [Firmicutes bacterium HGW-Firmicutes-1]
MIKGLLAKIITPVTIIELDARYSNKLALTNAVALKLTKEGSQCEIIDKDTIVIDGCRFSVKEKNYYRPVPVQQVILRKITL